MPDETATTDLVHSVYAALAAREMSLARSLLDGEFEIEEKTGSELVSLGNGGDGLATFLARYDEQFREFKIEPLEVEAFAEKALVRVRIGGMGISGAEQWSTGYHVLTVEGGKLARLQLFAERGEAAEAVELSLDGSGDQSVGELDA